MSQDFLDDELIGDFIVESREHLETIEPNLLELEKSPENLVLLNDIFRPMHSLKGASGFLGLGRINKLAHRSENILDELRKGTMMVDPVIMDVILSATDAFNQMLINLENTGAEGDVPIDHIVDLMDRIMKGEQLEAVDETPTAPTPTMETQAPAQTAPPEEMPTEIMQVPQVAEAPVLQSEHVPTMTTLEWIDSLPTKPKIQLVAFGESHLKDFVDEALENIENLSTGLFELEKNPDDAETVNNLFRFFHNLKGNSGMLGYHELNALTHESETLLNRARQHELEITSKLIDLLLVVVDAMEVLIEQVDVVASSASPFDSSELLQQLQAVVAGNEPDLPPSLRSNIATQSTQIKKFVPIGAEGQNQNDDLEMFRLAVQQQEVIIANALKALASDPTIKAHQDALYRSFVAIQNSATFMEFGELTEYAQRTAGIVDQARSSDSIDFDCILSLLDQETETMVDMADDCINEAKANIASAENAAASPVPVTSPAAATSPAPVASPAAATSPAPVASPAAAAKVMKTSAGAPKVEDKKQTEQKAASSIRVDYEKLDHLMNLIGELLINRNRYAMIAKNLESAPPDIDMIAVAQDLSETTYAMSRVSDDLQDTLMKVRMLPVSSVFSRFPRLVRDISRKSNKEIELVLEGEETELDKSIVESINDPLMHLIRNSLDHGIEAPDVRIAAGKSPVGKVTLRAYHKGNSVVIEVEDDGKGIDPEKMREVAIKKGVISAEEARALSDKEAIELIFAPGFSSAEVVTDISGRGVGMDVVRTNIKNLKGNISIHTVPGEGSRFTLSLPLTLAIIEALMIKMGEQMYAIPLDAVATTTKLDSSMLTSINGRKAVTLRGEVLGIVDLGELLDLPETLENDVISVVILQDHDKRIGLVVNQLLDRQEIVIKPLGAYLNNILGLSGASIMGDGSVVLILDPHGIYTLASPKPTGS